MRYAGKIVCEQCSKPIGELLEIFPGNVIHQPYISYRQYNKQEICNMCLSKVKEDHIRTAWRKQQGII